MFLDFEILEYMEVTKSININKSNRMFPYPVPEGRETGRFLGIYRMSGKTNTSVLLVKKGRKYTLWK